MFFYPRWFVIEWNGKCRWFFHKDILLWGKFITHVTYFYWLNVLKCLYSYIFFQFKRYRKFFIREEQVFLSPLLREISNTEYSIQSAVVSDYISKELEEARSSFCSATALSFSFILQEHHAHSKKKSSLKIPSSKLGKL